MMPFAPEDRGLPARWAISAVIVLLVHGTIAAVIATWRVVM
jgi:hypothetical protein